MGDGMTFGDAFRARYEVTRTLGEGANGRVLLAHDRNLDRPVAIKFLLAAKPGSEELERFLEEARVTAQLSHPNIIPLLDHGTDLERPFLVFEFIEGRDLAGIVAERGRLPVDETLALARGILEGLGAAHQAGVVHRDVKPHNVMVRTDGVPLVADFGLARAGTREGIHTQTGVILGTPLYLAPERILGSEATVACDLYAVACTVYECLAGAPPFTHASASVVLEMHMRQEPPALEDAAPGVPRGLAAAVRRGLAKNPAERYADAAEMIGALCASPKGSGRTVVGGDARNVLRSSAGGGTQAILSSQPGKETATRPGNEPARTMATPRSRPGRSGGVVRSGGVSARPVPVAPPALPVRAIAVAGIGVGLLLAITAYALRPRAPDPVPAIVSATPSPKPAKLDPDRELVRETINALKTVNMGGALKDVLAIPFKPGAKRALYNKQVGDLQPDTESGVVMDDVYPANRPGEAPVMPPGLRAKPHEVDRLVAAIKDSIPAALSRCAKLAERRAHLFGPGGLDAEEAFELYKWLYDLTILDLVPRSQHMPDRELGFEGLTEPLVRVLPSEIGMALKPSATVEISGLQCLTLIAGEKLRGDLAVWITANHTMLRKELRMPNATVEELANRYQSNVFEVKMPKYPPVLRNGPVALRIGAMMWSSIFFFEIRLPRRDFTRGERIKLRVTHPGTEDAHLALDGWELPKGYRVKEQRALSPDDPRRAVVHKKVVNVGAGVVFPGAWLPDENDPVEVIFAMPPGITDPAEVHDHARTTILTSLTLIPAPPAVVAAPLRPFKP